MLMECDNCRASVNAEEISSFINTNPYDPIDSTKFVFLKCPSCSSPILAEQEFTYVFDQFEWGATKKIYPTSIFHVNPAIPEVLRKALSECIQCFRADAFTATAIMCRRVIEGFCLLKGIKNKSLDKAIKQLKEDGVINEQLYEWANQLRLVGNEAAHNIEVDFTSQDAQDILDFTIAILDFTYSFKEKFDQFRNRRRTR